MGAKQSKRSVDISGKEAESAGEVAAGAGGEGRVEQLADADALKPQLNGDAHIHDTAEKVKELDSGTPENEKDATTEKEGKEQEEEKEKESSVITNGDSELKADSGESTPSPEDTKKPKKEKVKKKWSLRSISFSRKDKPKQEKKQKEEEAKTNGEPEKVPEEVAETSPEKETNGVIQEDKSETETRDEKTPDTPVTEPITNGSSSPETPPEQTPTTDEPTNATKENERTESPKEEVAPEQLPINGLPLEEPKIEIAEPVETVACKAEETTVEKSEPVPATEIPDKNEVCVEKSPLIEPSPPPLPANPPPSSVASFAATTMAPELTDASLANPAEVTSNATRVDIPEINSEIKVEPVSIDVQRIDPIVETETVMEVESTEVEQPIVTSESDADVNNEEIPISNEDKTDSEVQETVSIDIPQDNINLENNVSNDIEALNDSDDIKNEVQSINADRKSPETVVDDLPEHNVVITDNGKDSANDDENKQLQPIERDVALATSKTDSENGMTEHSEAPKESIQSDDLKETNKMKDSTQTVEVVECNGRLEDEKAMTNGEATPAIDDAADSAPPSLSDASLPPPPSELGDAPAPQEVISVSDKMAELIPEVPSVPELKTELETTTDVAVAN
ncbi:A-kinase anchor protein 200 [Maniola jurtina]|uniref:A-kinase anchor protein 200 n=1 Tax=Maniola jurtina TaxID=191418 RepID=UPI001E68DAB8|nr:A-kinase anchor protein 200 [Maniola jurtina]